MIRLATCFWLVIATILGGALYQVKNEVQTLESELASLNRTILNDQEAIHVLHAEWSYLNQPERLSKLNARYLELAPINAAQVAMIDDLPVRLIEPEFDLGPDADTAPNDLANDQTNDQTNDQDMIFLAGAAQ